MAYDEALAARVRAALGEAAGHSERRMMGAICFFLNGNMIGGADRTKSGLGRFMFRVSKENMAEAMSRKGASIMELGGKRMSGFVFVEADACDDALLSDWLSLALRFVRTLPPK